MSGKTININNGIPYLTSDICKLRSVPIWGAPASLIIYKKEIYNKLKGFDASFFAYIEDVDLAYRLAKNNYKTLYIPSAISYHLGGGTSSKMGYLREWLSFRNWIKLINKNYTLSQKIIYFIPIIGQRLRNLKYLLVKLVTYDHRH
jgi:GT2 family glycosyltransferase